jgi:hypothetical protein
MKIAKFLGGLILGCISLGVACSSDEHQLAQAVAVQGPTRCEDLGKAEGRDDIRSYCVEFTYDSCPGGAWAAKYGSGDTPRWTCGDDVTLGCCMPGVEPRLPSCANPRGYGGKCLPYSPDGCQDGRWLPKSITDCAEGQGCCAPVSCVQGHGGQCLPYSQNGCPGGGWVPETITDCVEGESCCAPWTDGGLPR